METVFPSRYMEILNDGLLDYNKPVRGHTFLCHNNDFEILRFEDVASETTHLYNSGYFEIVPNYTFIPFAKSGAGDWYCFYYETKKSEPSIAYLWHDANRAEILAPNIQDYIYLSLVRYILSPSPHNWDYIRLHSRYLSRNQKTTFGSPANIDIQKLKQHACTTGTEFPYQVQKTEIIPDRYVGELRLCIPPELTQFSDLQGHIKSLNWRKAKEPADGCSVYFRKNHVFMGNVDFDNISDTYQGKIREITAQYPEVTVRFERYDTGEILPLIPT